jgi:hypothetical protein
MTISRRLGGSAAIRQVATGIIEEAIAAATSWGRPGLELIMLLHGESAPDNLRGDWGLLDPPLSRVGQRQAEAVRCARPPWAASESWLSAPASSPEPTIPQIATGALRLPSPEGISCGGSNYSSTLAPRMRTSGEPAATPFARSGQ